MARYRILALDGGGIRGIVTTLILERLAQYPGLERAFDHTYLVAGNSSGALIALAMARIIRRHPDPFVKIATGAIMCWVIGQALMNIAVVIGLAPVIGVPLPLVSAGGSALIITMAAMGVVIAFARSEPGAAEALAARSGVVRRSLAVIGRVRGASPARTRRA